MIPYLIVPLNLSELGFSFVVFHGKSKRTQQGNLLGPHTNTKDIAAAKDLLLSSMTTYDHLLPQPKYVVFEQIDFSTINYLYSQCRFTSVV